MRPTPYNRNLKTTPFLDELSKKSIFAEGGRAEIWFSDDAERVMLQILEGLGASVEKLEPNVYRIHAAGTLASKHSANSILCSSGSAKTSALSFSK